MLSLALSSLTDSASRSFHGISQQRKAQPVATRQPCSGGPYSLALALPRPQWSKRNTLPPARVRLSSAAAMPLTCLTKRQLRHCDILVCEACCLAVPCMPIHLVVACVQNLLSALMQSCVLRQAVHHMCCAKSSRLLSMLMMTPCHWQAAVDSAYSHVCCMRRPALPAHTSQHQQSCRSYPSLHPQRRHSLHV